VSNIGIVVLATNKYFPLGLRLIKRWRYFYCGDNNFIFYFYSDKDPKDYIENVIWKRLEHDDLWFNIAIKKFNAVIDLHNKELDYIFCVDADTNIHKNFYDENFLEDLVAVEHFQNQKGMINDKPYDSNRMSNAYVSKDFLDNPIYYQTNFFGGNNINMHTMCFTCKRWGDEDLEKGYKPTWADEAYLNKYLNVNMKPKKIMTYEKHTATPNNVGPWKHDEYHCGPFAMSEKGDSQLFYAGIDAKPFFNITEERYQELLEAIKKNKDCFVWDIVKNRLSC